MINISKRRYYNNRDYTVDLKNQVVKLSPSHIEKLDNKKMWGGKGYKKVTGSNIANILLADLPYKSEFKAFINIAHLGMPILDEKYVNAGNIIEPKVVDYIEKKTNYKLETYDPNKYRWDYFLEVDNIVGGLPDGFIKEQNTIIEIKTGGEKKEANWDRYGMDKGYIKQAQLYAYLKKADKFIIVATFLKEQDYGNPHNFPINDRKVRNYVFELDELKAQDDIDKVKKWYKFYTAKHYSPKFSFSNDGDLLAYLKCNNKDEYETLLREWEESGKLKVGFTR